LLSTGFFCLTQAAPSWRGLFLEFLDGRRKESEIRETERDQRGRWFSWLVGWLAGLKCLICVARKLVIHSLSRPFPGSLWSSLECKSIVCTTTTTTQLVPKKHELAAFSGRQTGHRTNNISTRNTVPEDAPSVVKAKSEHTEVRMPSLRTSEEPSSSTMDNTTRKQAARRLCFHLAPAHWQLLPLPAREAYVWLAGSTRA